MAGDIKIGTYTGTGAAVNVPCGWIPDMVEVWNETDADYMGVWFQGMADGISLDIATAVAANAAGGLSKLESTTLGRGFIAGTDFSENGKVYRYRAMRGDQ